MFRTAIVFLYVVGYMIAALPGLLHAKLLEKKPEKHAAFCRKKIMKFVRRMIKVIGMQVEVRGLENIPEEATLTVYNHQSLLDAFVLIGKMPNTESMVAKKELEKVPLISAWMRAGHCIFIDRSSPRAGLLCIKKGAELLSNGINVTIAPEGTRNRGGEMLEFKGGAFKMATHAKAPILPVAIEGTYKLFETNKNRIKAGKVIMEVLPPIPTAGLSREEEKALPAKVAAMIKDKVEALREEMNG